MLSFWLVCLVSASTSAQAVTQVRLSLDPDVAGVRHMSWDTEGGARCETNLLRKDMPVTFEGSGEGAWRDIGSHIGLNGRVVEDGFDLTLSLEPSLQTPVERVRITLPFDPGVTPTTVLPKAIEADGTLHLPAIVSAPGFGQMLVSADPVTGVIGHLNGSRKAKTLDWVIEVPVRTADEPATLRFRAVRLAAPEGLGDDSRWRLARRGWFDGLNLTSQWGDQSAGHSAPVGILGNNVLSDPASCSLWMYADLVLFTPALPGSADPARYLRRSLDHWLDNRTQPNGNVICYWDYDTFLDPLPGILISAWDYVAVSRDMAWLSARRERLEQIAAYAMSRDIDDDGLIEAVQTGNRGTLKQPLRSSCWFDALNFGHKDAYANALMYRAFCCLSDLEKMLDRPEKAAEYAERARRLKQAYVPALLNPETGWIAMWRSADGELHDYASPIVNGYAIEYGLVDRETGRDILRRLHAKLDAVGFTNFQFGVPCILDPVPPDDYLQPAIGAAQQPDGRDTWQIYMNGGITAGQVYHYLAAHYAVGLDAEGDQVLDAMLQTQFAGGFQNGVRDAFPEGIDWRKWDGQPCGYEGFLADNARFLIAVLTRNASFRERLYGPLTLGEGSPAK